MKFLLLMLVSNFIYPSNQNKTEAIEGIWQNEEKTRTLKIYYHHGVYNAKIHTMVTVKDKDFFVGQLVIEGLKFQNKLYTNGKAFTPDYGWVNCSAQINSKGVLEITGKKFGITKMRTYKRIN